MWADIGGGGADVCGVLGSDNAGDDDGTETARQMCVGRSVSGM